MSDLPLNSALLAERRAPSGACAAAGVACTHCGLPVPAGLVQPGSATQFCCAGCETVYAVIRDNGFEKFYQMRSGDRWTAAAGRATGRRYDEYDDAAFQDVYCRPCGGELRSIDLVVEGVHCASCVWLIEKLPRFAPGVIAARLDVRRARVRVTWDPQRARLAEVARALDSLGYPPHPARGAAAEQIRAREDRRFLNRLAIAGAASGNAMLLAFAMYAGEFSGIEPAYATLLRWASAFVGVVAVAWPGAVFFRGALAALRVRAPHIDIPIALGLGVGAIASVANTALGRDIVYFDSLSMLVFLLLVARWIQRRQQQHATDAVELLLSMTPTRARVWRDNAWCDAAIDAVRPGDLVEVRAQETAPVDGEVVEGESRIDAALLTGESAPLPVAPGSAVHAGALSMSGRLVLRTTAVGANTRVGRLMQLVEESLQRKAPIVQLMDRIAGWFVVVVLILAAATLAGWLWISPAHAADHVVALLITACPCALGLATPLAIAMGVGRAARRGILVKGGPALELLARPGTIVLDKTGTVTCGRMSLARWHGPEAVKPLVAALENRASHPLARALRAGLPNDDTLVVSDVEQTARGGIEGVVGGRRVCIGSREFAQSRSQDANAEIERFAATAADESLTPVLIAVDGRLVAAAALGDTLRSDAPASVARLRRLGWRVQMLSGDHPAVVDRVAAALGIAAEDRRGGVAPEEKLDVVRDLARRGSVVMVGDGVNDAAALAAAHVGIAVHGGAEASFAAADVYIATEGLAPIVELIEASQRTVRVIRRNLVASLCYNAASVSLAIFGLITPLVAAILMPVSSITVVALTASARTFGGRR